MTVAEQICSIFSHTVAVKCRDKTAVLTEHGVLGEMFRPMYECP